MTSASTQWGCDFCLIIVFDAQAGHKRGAEEPVPEAGEGRRSEVLQQKCLAVFDESVEVQDERKGNDSSIQPDDIQPDVVVRLYSAPAA